MSFGIASARPDTSLIASRNLKWLLMATHSGHAMWRLGYLTPGGAAVRPLPRVATNIGLLVGEYP